VEFARNVLGYRDADHAETSPDAETLVVTPLSCSLVGQDQVVTVLPGSRSAALYGRAEAAARRAASGAAAGPGTAAPGSAGSGRWESGAGGGGQSGSVVESYWCNYGLSEEWEARLEAGGLRVAGRGADGEARIVELDGHPFFLGTLFLPQLRSSPGSPHPLLAAFAAAARG
jgi:CTP synthase (UTP-ammonia lyase)